MRARLLLGAALFSFIKLCALPLTRFNSIDWRRGGSISAPLAFIGRKASHDKDNNDYVGLLTKRQTRRRYRQALQLEGPVGGAAKRMGEITLITKVHLASREAQGGRERQLGALKGPSNTSQAG